MSAKAIYEATGKDLLNRFLNHTSATAYFVSVNEKTNLADLTIHHPWLNNGQVCFNFFSSNFILIYLNILIAIGCET